MRIDLHYMAMASFNSVKQLMQQMQVDNLNIQDLFLIRDSFGGSMLEAALSGRNYEVAEWLMDANHPVNIITRELYNELHIIAPHLDESEAVILADRLLDRGVDLAQQDKRFHNTAMFDIVMNVIRHPNPANQRFLNKCIQQQKGLRELNIRDYSACKILQERGYIV